MADAVQLEVSDISQSTNSIEWSKLERPSTEHVKHRFTGARYVHFICHRVLNSEGPLESPLKVWQDLKSEKGRVESLRLSEITSWQTPKTALVFLSACSVADAANDSLSDENSDIAKVFAVAVVPKVVGSI